MYRLARCVVMVCLFGCVSSAWADVKPHALISEGMVLQQGRDVNLWGSADPGEKISVGFRDQEVSTAAGDDGKWLIRLASKAAGGPFPLTIVGKNTIALKNVLVGEVWVCSGQSNMGWPMATRLGSADVVGTENESIRLFTVPPRLLDAPTNELDSQWRECSPAALINFSAVAYWFGRRIHETQQVPIGLIHTSYGGSGVGAWTSSQALANDPELSDLRTRRARQAAQVAEQNERLKPEIERYQAAVAKARQEGKTPPPPPRGMTASPVTSRLYNGMVSPLLPFTIRGVIWYQGEADTGQAGNYRSLFGALIRDWRHAWQQGDFPFLFVQIAPHKKIVDQPRESDWAALREAQLQTSQMVPHTGMVVITDWGHETDIHVKQKRPVGERLAILARALVYGEQGIYSGPRYEGLKVEGQRAVLSFTHLGAGLTTKRMALEDVRPDGQGASGGALHVVADNTLAANASLQGFTIAGEDRQFFNAQAEIHGDTVVVFSPRVETPVAVRYGWADYPVGNLFNREGLPASPFRTDGWPLQTEPKVMPSPARR